MHTKYPEKFHNIVSDKKFLLQPSYQVPLDTEGYPELMKELVDHTEDIMYIDPDKGNIPDNIIGYGLAACQLQIVKDNIPPTNTCIKPLNDSGYAPRMGIIRVPAFSPQQRSLELNMVNPQILNMTAPKSYKGEGCLSFPGDYRTTLRHRYVQIGFLDALTLEPREMELYGIEAVIAQHELDHMDGILFFDHERKQAVADNVPGPNEQCICGSGKKYKKCCMGKIYQ